MYAPVPTLIGDRVRLGVDGLVSADGATLQEAADELVATILGVVKALRSGGIAGMSSELCRPNMDLVKFIWELRELAAAGGESASACSGRPAWRRRRAPLGGCRLRARPRAVHASVADSPLGTEALPVTHRARGRFGQVSRTRPKRRQRPYTTTSSLGRAIR